MKTPKNKDIYAAYDYASVNQLISNPSDPHHVLAATNAVLSDRGFEQVGGLPDLLDREPFLQADQPDTPTEPDAPPAPALEPVAPESEPEVAEQTDWRADEEDEDAPEEQSDAAAAFDSLSYNELKQLCSRHSIKASGSKAKLVERLTAAGVEL